ncbi:ESAT-6 protein secretion system EspG family protein [Tamaricihabitans halophyticus]|uniref:ESAT-6 protein secretion system EspG family protein n=1 Tax=Tamaricihabitans halophyticus TaxID=1262583 RepID=A0A4R2RBE0_9PSEU|nr:ESX secretion-associated protein EspG [Tamaricihabitans halophyticus]TCP56735.1 ESAT-6 protein secretion system EspG family protein [Tamaricihabitans halophyticus]
MPAGVGFGPLELDFLWESLGTTELPYPFEQYSHGSTVGERAALRRQVMAGLRDRRVLDDTGRVVPEVEDWLMLLATAELSVDAVFLPEGAAQGVRKVLAAGTAERAVLARQDERGTWLAPLPPSALASAVVDELPAAGRGAEQSITLPTRELTAAQQQGFRPVNSGRQSDEDTRTALARLFAQPRLRGGQIAANARGRLGGRNRSRVLGWFDTESGRYLTQSSGGAGGEEWLTIAPADAPTLRHRIGELLNGVRASNGGR